MEHNSVTSCDKKFMARARSCNGGTPLRLRGERKTFNVNEAVRSLDLALCRLKKGRISSENCASHSHANPIRRGMTMADMFIDSRSAASTNAQGTDNASLMSMNFSHYELMRNLSRSNCNSEGGAFSGSASTIVSPTDTSDKNEHLERYFRSAEMWTRRCTGGPSGMRFELPEK